MNIIIIISSSSAVHFLKRYIYLFNIAVKINKLFFAINFKCLIH